MPVTPVAQKTEAGGLEVQGQPGELVEGSLKIKNKKAWECSLVVECPLCSIPNTAKAKFQDSNKSCD